MKTFYFGGKKTLSGSKYKTQRTQVQKAYLIYVKYSGLNICI